MKIALCNEVLREMDFPAQCSYAAALGYDGLEVAPFTLDPDPPTLSRSARSGIRRVAADNGIEIIGLHWLLVAPAGLSINSKDLSTRQRTIDVMRSLIELCAELGGRVLVHGSPMQRRIEDGDDPKDARARAMETFAAVRDEAEAARIVYCVEPLGVSETNFINTVNEAVELVKEIGSPAFRTMIDTKASRESETQSVAELIRLWHPEGMIGHVQVNDRNKRGPGQGDDEFSSVFAALEEVAYQGAVSVEPFDYYPDPRSAAAHALGYIRGILQTLPELNRD